MLFEGKKEGPEGGKAGRDKYLKVERYIPAFSSSSFTSSLILVPFDKAVYIIVYLFFCVRREYDYFHLRRHERTALCATRSWE